MRQYQLLSLFLLSLLHLQSCSSQSAPDDFDQYLSYIPELVLPLEIRCDGEYESIDSLIPQHLSELFRPSGYPNVWRKIPISDSIHGIFFLYPADAILPVLRTYQNGAVLIDSLRMIDQYCGLEYESEGYSWIKIVENRIELSDTTKFWERDEQYEKISGSERTVTRRSQFMIRSDGKIVKVNL